LKFYPGRKVAIFFTIQTVTYDATHTYQFSQRNRLLTVDNGTTANYNYDRDGRKVKKVTDSMTTLYFSLFR
jgi:hypothetical protein